MTRTTRSFGEPAVNQAHLLSRGGEVSLNSPPVRLPRNRTVALPRSPGALATVGGLVRRECVPAQVPPACPLCGAPVEPAHALDTRATRGWWCQLTRSLHFWQWRATVLKEGTAGRRYVLPPAPRSGGIPRYPGVTFEDLDRAQVDMRADRARWAAQGYKPNE